MDWKDFSSRNKKAIEENSLHAIISQFPNRLWFVGEENTDCLPKEKLDGPYPRSLYFKYFE